jgi:hypothetical protein
MRLAPPGTEKHSKSGKLGYVPLRLIALKQAETLAESAIEADMETLRQEVEHDRADSE